MEKEKALEIWDAIFGKNIYWMQDCFGAWMYRDDYGDVKTARKRPGGDGNNHLYGWEIDHIRPKSDFSNEKNADFLNNYEPVQWMNNRDKADSYPHFNLGKRQYRVVKCNICHSNGYNGYGIIDENGNRIDWKGRLSKYFPTNR